MLFRCCVRLVVGRSIAHFARCETVVWWGAYLIDRPLVAYLHRPLGGDVCSGEDHCSRGWKRSQSQSQS